MVAMARLDHLHMHMGSSRLDIETLLIREPDFSGFTIGYCMLFGQAVQSQKCGATGVSNDGCSLVGKIAVAAFISQAGRDGDQFICELSTNANATDSVALSKFRSLILVASCFCPFGSMACQFLSTQTVFGASVH